VAGETVESIEKKNKNKNKNKPWKGESWGQ
jgi:hypothetical protein